MIKSICTYVQRFGVNLPRQCDQQDLGGHASAGMCDLVTFGYMTSHLKKYNLWPMPKAPYEGLSIWKISEMVLHMSPPSFCYEIQLAEKRGAAKVPVVESSRRGVAAAPHPSLSMPAKYCREITRDIRLFLVDRDENASDICFRKFRKSYIGPGLSRNSEYLGR